MKTFSCLGSLIIGLAVLFTGCMSVTERSHSIQQKEAVKKNASTVYVWTGGFQRQEIVQFLSDSLPLRAIAHQEVGVEWVAQPSSTHIG